MAAPRPTTIPGPIIPRVIFIILGTVHRLTRIISRRKLDRTPMSLKLQWMTSLKAETLKAENTMFRRVVVKFPITLPLVSETISDREKTDRV